MRKIETLRARIAIVQAERAALLRQKRNRAQVIPVSYTHLTLPTNREV